MVPCCRVPLCWEVTGGLTDITKSREGLSGPAQTSPGEHPIEIPGLAQARAAQIQASSGLGQNTSKHQSANNKSWGEQRQCGKKQGKQGRDISP